ncbi:MAG: ABC transporter substrate-binding protein [Bacteroidia bacterium]|nr:ABC transporter substrate-binding protein [Bacteroidia bacterium]
MRHLLFIISLLCASISLIGQNDSTSTWAIDPLANEYLGVGKKLMAARDYRKAIAVLDSAIGRPTHPQTTSAVYLRGLSWFYLGEEDSAMTSFHRFLKAYPLSTYAPDVRFHRAILLLEGKPDNRREGIDQLISLTRQDSIPSLSALAHTKLREYFFTSCDTVLLVGLLEETRKEGVATYLEPYCFCLKEKHGQPMAAIQTYEAYRKAGGEELPFLERLFDPRRPDRYGQRSEIKIAVFLPLFLDESVTTSSDIPRNSKIALEFWEGLQMAYEEMEPQLHRKITLRVFDTQRDSLVVEKQMQELDQWYPDLVIGAVYNTQTEIISRWSERTGTPQIVPFSPSETLIENKSFTFLAHPEIGVHGKQLATYGIDSLALKRVVIFTNGTDATERLAQPFAMSFRQQGGEVITLELDSVFSEKSTKRTMALVRSLRQQRFDGIFIPIFGDQETVGLILSQLSVMDIDVPVLGSPHSWKRFTNIDRDLKERFQLTFSTSFMYDKADTNYRNYMRQHLEQFHLPPSEFHTQGYDIGKWVLQVTNEYPFQYLSLADYFRQYPSYDGIHQTFDLKGTQGNQAVNLGKFVDGDVRKIKTGPQWMILPSSNE